MVNCGRIITTLLSLGFVSRGVAGNAIPLNITRVEYVPVVRDWDNGNGTMTTHYGSVLPDSPLLSHDTQLAIRDEVTIQYATVLTVASAVIVAASNSITICKTIAREINYRSTANECSLVYGTAMDGVKIEGYSYRASTTGTNCKTSAVYAEILKAVNECVNDLHNQKATTGCCKFRHAGSWTGHLRVTSMPEKHPVEDIVCNFSSD
ncbi:hypothetical protein N7454_009325 [Penicillium verhagenii]|nr:hypothetical protein N7454_009325 [Penicillium verhagenii]